MPPQEPTGAEPLPDRPLPVTLAAGLLLAGAIVLTSTWAFGIDAVASNGARVFFVVLWGYLAWSVYAGGGWVRVVIIAMLAVTAWGGFNAPSVATAWQAAPFGEVVAKCLAAASLAAMLCPTARRWLAQAKALRAQAEAG